MNRNEGLPESKRKRFLLHIKAEKVEKVSKRKKEKKRIEFSGGVCVEDIKGLDWNTPVVQYTFRTFQPLSFSERYCAPRWREREKKKPSAQSIALNESIYVLKKKRKKKKKISSHINRPFIKTISLIVHVGNERKSANVFFHFSIETFNQQAIRYHHCHTQQKTYEICVKLRIR